LGFREVLAALYERHRRGLTSFDSECVAALMGWPTAKASKALGRLHRMGFLRRTRLKRECLSKRGKLCHKGYRYEYSLSSQGLKYAKWMAGVRPLELAMGLGIASEAAPHIPGDLGRAISSYALRRASSRYKGSNELLQALGPLSLALPALAKGLEEANSRCERLEEKRKELEGALDLALRIIAQLHYERAELERIALELGSGLIKAFKMMGVHEMLGGFNEALWLRGEIYRKMCADLASGLIIFARDSDQALAFLKLVEAHYAHLWAVERSLGEAMRLIHSEALKQCSALRLNSSFASTSLSKGIQWVTSLGRPLEPTKKSYLVSIDEGIRNCDDPILNHRGR